MHIVTQATFYTCIIQISSRLWRDSQVFKDSKKYFGPLSLDKSFELGDKKGFATLYNELFNYSISWQIHNAKESEKQ